MRETANRDACMALLREERRNQLLKLKSEEEQCRGLAATLLLRLALEEEGISYEESSFSFGKYGKPEIVNQNMHINMSHAGNYAACAVSDCVVGVDVERITRLAGKNEQAYRIAKRILGEQEMRIWQERGQKPLELLKAWTRKESYVKMTGLGLSTELKDVDIIAGAFFEEIQPEEDYLISVCTREKHSVQIFDWTKRL